MVLIGGGLNAHSLAELTQAVPDLLQVLLQFGLLPQQMLFLTGLQRQQEQREISRSVTMRG